MNYNGVSVLASAENPILDMIDSLFWSQQCDVKLDIN